ncbi:UDP-N-acetylglucosamine 2-epimerase (non-hydrolyzing) [Filobacillus milosensis]|uniref:UDP-N-acetylglucosamine 2-epimerase (Non-hydrolyzing) n=1 Tax=Filobacillus milosensis TaxID=94137 RepID=A0A4Y8IGD7_9BACI|nr:UDP-N-acetylglucosamine 2-epimerase (non-hydrolyzing) [Filobacillus milosensis]TFB14174.1 UDP-N-acetylglucosamine 2-epimerase (non-hydrolyzing) [Filobacillus milosensis]
MEKLKVMTVVGTRPEIIRLSAVINKLEGSDAIDHTLVHTGQNYDYELNEVFFKDFNLRKPDYFLDAAQGSAIETIGNIFMAIDPVLDKVQPDALLVLGDTNSCLTAIAAKRKKIPIFHMEAGNRCFDQRVPEETNRKIVDHTADINLTYSDIAREYLLREGLPADRIIKTGSPMFEVLNWKKNDIKKSKVLDKLELNENEYFVVSAHREENINSKENFNNLVDSLNAIAQHFGIPVIVSTHPRTRKMIDSSGVELHPLIKTLKPLGFNDYNKLQLCSRAVLSDSGTISEESSILGFTALNIRQAHERPEAMEEASVMMVGLQKNRILQGIEVLDTQEENTLRLVYDYSMPNVSEKVLRIILSYTDYVNRVVWRNSN